MKILKWGFTLLLAFALVGCANMSKQDMGTIGGGVLGGLIGSRFGGGTGQVAAAVGGTLIGAYIGSQVGKSMDRQDRLEMNQALERTRTNQSYSWKNPDNGASYTVRPTKTYQRSGQPCREFTTTAIIGGEKKSVYGTACRQPGGSWKVQS